MWDWWLDCLYRLSKLVEIQMINCISTKFTPPAHTRPESPDIYWILLWRLMSDDACVVWGHSPVDINSHKLSSWKVVHQCVLTCSYWWKPSAQFVTISVEGLWPQTTYASLSHYGCMQAAYDRKMQPACSLHTIVCSMHTIVCGLHTLVCIMHTLVCWGSTLKNTRSGSNLWIFITNGQLLTCQSPGILNIDVVDIACLPVTPVRLVVSWQ